MVRVTLSRNVDGS